MSLGILIGRLGDFLDNHAPYGWEEVTLKAAFDPAVARIREELNHHLIPLLLLSRADGNSASVERQVILGYCRERLVDTGKGLSAEEEVVLRAYIDNYRPTRMQLVSALKKLEHETKGGIEALISAAREVVDADKEHRSTEAQFLAKLADDLNAL